MTQQAERDRLIKTGLCKGNTLELAAYKKMLPDTLPPEVFDWCTGLLLSDASIQVNISEKNPGARIKMQQAARHIEFMETTMELLKPWVFSIQGKNKKMIEIATIQHKAFLPLIDLFHDGKTAIKPASCVFKRPQPCIENHLTPICVAAWYMGDGGKHYRACNFHTDGFLEADTKLLAQALTKLYNWQTRVIDEGYSDYLGHSKHSIQVRTASSDSFRQIISPFMVKYFEYKIPKPRIRAPKGQGSRKKSR